MNVLTKTEFNRKPATEIVELAPIKILSDGEPIGFFGNIKDFIYVGDLHPRVKIQLRAREELVRKGMVSKDIRITYEEAKKETDEQED